MKTRASKTNLGFTLVEFLISNSIALISLMAVLGMFLFFTRYKSAERIPEALSGWKNELTLTLLDNEAWKNTVEDEKNMSLECLRLPKKGVGGMSCLSGGGEIRVRDSNNDVVFNSLDPTHGIKYDGYRCYEFIDLSGEGNSDCPIRVIVSWSTICEVPCMFPLIKLDIQFQHNPSPGSNIVLNPAKYNSTIYLHGVYGIKELSYSQHLTKCFVDDFGKPYCWGNNQDGQVPVFPPLNPIVSPKQLELFPLVSSAQASVGHFCGIDENFRINCFGDNKLGELGEKGNATASDQKSLQSLRVLKSSGGLGNDCALTIGGHLYCWGANLFGQLGIDPIKTMGPKLYFPTRVLKNTKVIDVVSGWYHKCALGDDGDVFCWGQNQFHQISAEEKAYFAMPKRVVGLGSHAIAIAAGGTHTCVILKDGDVSCWGSNLTGQIGSGIRSKFVTLPHRLDLGEPVVGITAGGFFDTKIYEDMGKGHTCALTQSSQKVYCWGDNSKSQLGIPVDEAFKPQESVGLPDRVLQVQASTGSTCALLRSGEVYCWGWNKDAQLGNGITWAESSSDPVKVVLPF